ncbi:SHOCT domain-containing protein [Streptomyces sp. NPDC002994]|uniref:SHOCT domain-containing protein n=1 Tax=Streptomyces sp. NPDC002994 TaxID=3154441 RepID=UPI0033BEDF68
MNTLAHEGPGPWILFFPLIWAAVVVGVVTVLRRTGVWRGGRTGRRGPWQERVSHSESSPIAMLGRRFASGEIDEEEYWRRLSVLDEQFGRTASKGGAA